MKATLMVAFFIKESIYIDKGMKINKGDFLKKLDEGLSIVEIIDANLNLIGNDDSVDTPEQVTNNATTDSFVDASRQQVGKNRLFATFLEEDDIVETNSAIEGKKYHVPHNVIQSLQSIRDGEEGSDRAKELINNPTMNYGQVKRFKHDIENKYNGNWTTALTWINSILSVDRNMVDNQKRTTMEIGMENRFRKTHDKDYDSNLTPLSSLTENKKIKIMVNESQYKLINESEDFTKYKISALRIMVKEKKEEINKLKGEIKNINEILNNKVRNNIEENKKK